MLHHNMNNLKKGFTLIELLMTIAIIGVLSSVLMVNLQGFRERTRDTIRKKDLRTIQTALELYRSNNSNYPASLPACGTAFTGGSVNYLQKMPCDPLTNARYTYTLVGSVYSLIACLENAGDAERDSSINGGCSNASMTVQSL